MTLYLDNGCLGAKFLLLSVTPDYYGAGKEKHDEPVGHKYTVLLTDAGYERLVVKIEGRQLLDQPLSGHEPLVVFEELLVRPYVDRTGRIALTASAKSVEIAKA